MIAIPSIVAAAKLAKRHIYFVVHTDRPSDFGNCFGGFPCELRAAPSGANMEHLGALHQDVLRSARPGDYFSPFNADHVLSCEVFAAAEKHLDAGKRLVMYAAPRTVGTPPEAGSDAAAVIDFFLANPHPEVVRATWTSPGTFHPSVIYQRNGDNVCANGFHLHPVAVAITDKPIEFCSTVDNDMVGAFLPDECHVITDSTEMAMVEMSPPEKRLSGTHDDGGPPGALVLRSPNWVADWGLTLLPIHRWFFKHRIVYRGDPHAFPDDPVPRILAHMDEAPNGISTNAGGRAAAGC